MHTLKVPQETKNKGAFLGHCDCGEKGAEAEAGF